MGGGTREGKRRSEEMSESVQYHQDSSSEADGREAEKRPEEVKI